MRPVIPTPGSRRLARVLPCLLLVAGLGAACEPTVKIEADVLVRVEDKAKDDIAANPDIF